MNRAFKQSQFRKNLMECARNTGAGQSGALLDIMCKVLHTKTGDCGNASVKQTISH
jgi:hypothetical protein